MLLNIAIMKIAHNIKYLRGLKSLSQEKLADELGITRSRLGAYEENRNEPPIEILIKLSDYFHISIDVLIRVDLRKTKPENLIKLNNNRLLFPVVIDNDNKDRIEVITEKASAGYLNGYADPEYIESMPFMELPYDLSGKQRAFPIKGDSMPPLETGDYVVGKYLESLNEIINGRTYILLTQNDGIVYKRVNKVSKDKYELISDNTAYQSYTIKASDMLEVWEFTSSIKRSDRKNDEANLENIMDLMLSMKTEIENLKKR